MSYFFEHIGTIHYPVIEMRHITFGGVTGNCEANCDEEQSYCDAATGYLSLENCYKFVEKC